MPSVFRVDSELETLVETEVTDDAPIGYWLPVMLGDGYYAYFTEKDEAKRQLKHILETRLNDYKEKLENFDNLY